MALPPREFKMPTILLHDGKTDPAEYMSHYQSWMTIAQADPAIMRNAFSLTLTRIAQTWFDKVTPRSIHSFEQLQEEFATRFMGS